MRQQQVNKMTGKQGAQNPLKHKAMVDENSQKESRLTSHHVMEKAGPLKREHDKGVVAEELILHQT